MNAVLTWYFGSDGPSFQKQTDLISSFQFESRLQRQAGRTIWNFVALRCARICAAYSFAVDLQRDVNEMMSCGSQSAEGKMVDARCRCPECPVWQAEGSANIQHVRLKWNGRSLLAVRRQALGMKVNGRAFDV